MFEYQKLRWKEWPHYRELNKSAKKQSEAERAGKSQEEALLLKDMLGIYHRIEELRNAYASSIISKEQRRALKFGINSRPQGDQYYFTRDQGGQKVEWLNAEGLKVVRDKIRAEKKARWEMRQHAIQAFSGLGTFLAGITGVIGTLIGLFSVAC